MSQVVALLRKEWMMEIRQKHALAGVLVYVLATVFVCYLSFNKIEDVKVWGALLWITGLFTAFNAMQKTFSQENQGTQLLLYTMTHPRNIILSKAIYNALFVAGLNVFSLFFFVLFFGVDVLANVNFSQFIIGLLLGSTGLGLALTFIAGLAFKSGGGLGLVAILGFPVVMPLLITIVRHTTFALQGLSSSANSLNLLVLLVLNIVSFVLAYILFPYLWRE
jgi:heme exporter protein B